MIKQCKAEGQQQKPQSEVLNEKQASLYLNMSLAFLRRRRSQGTPPDSIPGPRFLKLGKSIRYRISDLDAWLEEHLKEVA